MYLHVVIYVFFQLLRFKLRIFIRYICDYAHIFLIVSIFILYSFDKNYVIFLTNIDTIYNEWYYLI